MVARTPEAPKPCRVANALPAVTDPIEACSPAAALPAATPELVNPASVKPPAPTTAAVLVAPTTFAVYLP